MGLASHGGVQEEDVRLALKGHIKEGYKFNPESPISPDRNEFYNKSPTSKDIVHLLVCVVPADTIILLPDKVIEKLRKIRKDASELNIPQVVIVTKIDQFCPEIEEDLKNVYKVADLKKKMETFSADVGVPMNCIFPVKNYHEEIDLKDEVDLLILSVLKSIINFCDDFMHFSHSRYEPV
ncbi:hypothetical protein ATANTOWER_029245 [Ataeniobius toweri]|uniref:Interferon-induced protein 44-like n=1 Tax=Ataeniobius toweri TaxID=208326 RepID=A0ABU7B2N3_9TELE|nr:hypothetical protein [Ataeniobius toweri]